MNILLLALIATLIVMAVLVIGRLGFGRREAFNARRFFHWFAWYFVMNYVLCLLIFLFDTRKNQGSFYPLAGLGIGSNVQDTIQSTRANIRGYTVDSIQLYQIYHTPTWVAIFVQSTSSGDIFQDVGIVDARNLSGGNVQFEPTLAAALQDYQQWLTQEANNSNTSTNGTTLTVMGKVLRVSAVRQGSDTIYYIQIAGQSKIFTANLSLSPKLPLVRSGDIVMGTYLNTRSIVVNFTSFDDLSMHLGGIPPPGSLPTLH